MSHRRMSTRKSALYLRSSNVAPTDEGGFNALQNSNFLLSSPRSDASTIPLSFRSTDTPNVTLPPDWGKNLRCSSIGFADNNKENDDQRSIINSDHDSEDPTFVRKKDAHMRRRLGKHDATSGSESDHDFENIIMSQAKASQKTQAASVEPALEDQNHSTSEEIQKEPEKLEKHKITKRKLRSFVLSEDSDNNDYQDIFDKVKSQQELRQKAKADTSFHKPLEHHNSSAVSSSEKKKSLSHRGERSRQSQLSNSEEDDIENTKTLRESIIHHKRDSFTSVDESTVAEDDQEESRPKTISDNENSANNIEDDSVHDSDKSFTSRTLTNIISKDRRGTYTVTQAIEKTQSDEKDLSSVSVHESDNRESLSNSTTSSQRDSQSKRTETQISKKQSNASEKKKDSLRSSNGRSSTQIEFQRRQTRSHSEKLVFSEESKREENIMNSMREDVSVHGSDQSSMSTSLKNINSRNSRESYKVLQAIQNTPSGEKDMSSVSVHESDRESLSNLAISSGNDSQSSKAEIEPQRRRTRSQSAKLGDTIEQAGILVDIHDAVTESESSRNKYSSKRKRAFEEDTVTSDTTALKKTKTTSEHTNRSSNKRNSTINSKEEVNQNQSLDKSANFTRNSQIETRSVSTKRYTAKAMRKSQSSVVSDKVSDEDAEPSQSVPIRGEVPELKKASETSMSKPKKNLNMTSSDSEDEEDVQSSRVSAYSKVQEPKKASKIPVLALNRSEKKTSLIYVDSEDEEAGQFVRLSTPAKVQKSKESAKTSLSKSTRSKNETSFVHNQSEDVNFDQTPVKVLDPTKTPDTSVQERRQSKNKASLELGVNEVEANNSFSSSPKKSKKDTPVKSTAPSPVASTSKQQSPLKKFARNAIFLKPVQPTLDTYFKRTEKLQPSELGLKYKSLQDFDEQHGAQLAPELLELRTQLLADPYIMQETNRIISERLANEEKERRTKEQAKLAREIEKKKKQEMELKKQKAQERKRQKEKQLSKFSDDYKVKGKVYNPKLAKPRKWCTTRLYNYLQKKMEPVHGLETTARSEQLVMTLVRAVDLITKTEKYQKYKECLNKLKRMLARNNIVVTHDDFWWFAYEYLPYNFRVKAVPMLLPGNVLTIPDWNTAWDDMPILDTI